MDRRTQQEVQNCKELAQHWFALSQQATNPNRHIYQRCAEQLASIVGSIELSGIPEVIIEAERHKIESE